MQGKARLLGHPIHQMLIVFPLGLLATAVVFDVLFLVTRDPDWALVAYWMVAAGVVGGLVAAPFGTIDWMSIPAGTRAKQVGLLHGLGNVLVLVLFVVSWVLRADPRDPPLVAIVCGWCGAAVSLATAWMGGELVSRLGVGVSDDAGLNAPSSLTTPPP